jgi:hypothetical protein
MGIWKWKRTKKNGRDLRREINEDENFHLCRKCIKRFNSLEFKRNAKLIPNLYPGYLAWEDEVPKQHNMLHSDRCYYSFIKLARVRRCLLYNKSLPANYQTFWEQALLSMPHWPGFRRTEASSDELEAIEQFQANLYD